MRAGKTNERITIRQYSLVADGAGGQTKSYSDLATVWADVRAGNGTERFDEERTNATAIVKFIIRNRRDIDERMRIVWRGVNYNIRGIMDEGPRDLYLTISAERGEP